ncbi:unnamed protein product [Linum trigynum]|uniref:Uncharacterized protein n=1 Tax=Linum trigynum TaxID=586398 RepID=A0AAV2DWX2_9ROSI
MAGTLRGPCSFLGFGELTLPIRPPCQFAQAAGPLARRTSRSLNLLLAGPPDRWLHFPLSPLPELSPPPVTISVRFCVFSRIPQLRFTLDLQLLCSKDAATPIQPRPAITLQLAEINTANASQLKTHHTSGRKSFAVVTDETEKATGKVPDRLELFRLTHKRPNEHVQAILEKADTLISQGITNGEQVFREVFSKEHGGRVRGAGFGPTPTIFYGPSFPGCADSTTSDMSTGSSTDHRVLSLERKVEELQKQVAAFTDRRPESSASVDVVNIEVGNHGSS